MNPIRKFLKYDKSSNYYSKNKVIKKGRFNIIDDDVKVFGVKYPFIKVGNDKTFKDTKIFNLAPDDYNNFITQIQSLANVNGDTIDGDLNVSSIRLGPFELVFNVTKLDVKYNGNIVASFNNTGSISYTSLFSDEGILDDVTVIDDITVIDDAMVVDDSIQDYKFIESLLGVLFSVVPVSNEFSITSQGNIVSNNSTILNLTY